MGPLLHIRVGIEIVVDKPAAKIDLDSERNPEDECLFGNPAPDIYVWTPLSRAGLLPAFSGWPAMP